MRNLKTVASDIALKIAVEAELEWDPEVDHSRLRVAAREGSIALTGNVTSYRQKRAAVRAAERIEGVQAVADDIQVVLPASVKRKDAEIAAEIAHERRWHTWIPDSVEVEVSKGMVTLRGHVQWSYQRDEAALAVSHLEAVRGVSNLIEVRPHVGPDAADVERRVEEALARASETAASIAVTTEEGVVRLKGTVRSLAQRRIAERAAAAAPGVTTVEDEIVVRPTSEEETNG